MRIHVSRYTIGGVGKNEVQQYVNVYMCQVWGIKAHRTVEQQHLVTQCAEAWTDSVWCLCDASLLPVDFLHRVHLLNWNCIHALTLANGTTLKVSASIVLVVEITELDGNRRGDSVQKHATVRPCLVFYVQNKGNLSGSILSPSMVVETHDEIK